MSGDRMQRFADRSRSSMPATLHIGSADKPRFDRAEPGPCLPKHRWHHRSRGGPGTSCTGLSRLPPKGRVAVAASKPRHPVQAIKQNRTLKQLSLAGSKVGEEGAFALLEAGSCHAACSKLTATPELFFLSPKPLFSSESRAPPCRLSEQAEWSGGSI